MTEAEKPDFATPGVVNNPVGWGPISIPEKYRDIPYQPFSKSDNLGQVHPVHVQIIAKIIYFCQIYTFFVADSAKYLFLLSFLPPLDKLHSIQITDWTGNLLERRYNYRNYNQQFGTGQHYSYFHEEDESSFQVLK